MQLVRNTIETNDYVNSLNILSDIDPVSPCFKASQNMAKIVESKRNAGKKAMEFSNETI